MRLLIADSSKYRHEICQNFYTTGFSNQKFYTLKAWLFQLTSQQRKCIKISNLGRFLLDLNLMCKIFTLLQNYHTKFSISTQIMQE